MQYTMDSLKDSIAKLQKTLYDLKNNDEYSECLLLTSEQYNKLKSALNTDIISLKQDLGAIKMPIYVADGQHYKYLQLELGKKYNKIGIIDD